MFHGVDDEFGDDDPDRHGAVGIDLHLVGREGQQLADTLAFGRVADVVDQRAQVLPERNRLDVVRRVEPAMHLRDRQDPPVGLAERLARFRAGRRGGLHVQECADELQTVADPVVDLVQQHLAFRRQCFEPVTRVAHRAVGSPLFEALTRIRQGRADRPLERVDAIGAEVLDHAARRSGRQGRGSDPRLARADEHDDGRPVGEGQDCVEHGRGSRTACKPEIERHDIDSALAQPGEPDRRADGQRDVEASRLELTLDKPVQNRIVIDQKQ